MTVTDEQIDALWIGEELSKPQIVRRRAIARAVLAAATPAGEPVGWMLESKHPPGAPLYARTLAMAEEWQRRGYQITPLVRQSAAAPTDERAAFEAWAKPLGLHLNLSRRTPGMFESMETTLIWEGWQARARLNAPSRP